MIESGSPEFGLDRLGVLGEATNPEINYAPRRVVCMDKHTFKNQIKRRFLKLLKPSLSFDAVKKGYIQLRKNPGQGNCTTCFGMIWVGTMDSLATPAYQPVRADTKEAECKSTPNTVM